MTNEELLSQIIAAMVDARVYEKALAAKEAELAALQARCAQLELLALPKPDDPVK